MGYRISVYLLLLVEAATAASPIFRRANITTSITNYNHCNAKCVTAIRTGQKSSCIGYAGEDCSFPYEVCPDSITQCFGEMAVCINKEGTTEAYECDCRSPPSYSIERTALLEDIQIQECKDRETEVCEKGKSISLYSFCTNGGRCLKFVDPGYPHPGCDCPGRFVGHHCQYRRGTAPDDRIDPSELQFSEIQTTRRRRLADWAIVLIVILGLLVVGILGYAFKIYKRFLVDHKSRKTDRSKDVIIISGIRDDDSSEFEMS